MTEVRYRYASLEDFVATSELTVDGQLDDGWGAKFPVKGREIEATILFSDISGFSARTRDLNPTETLALVNNFFAWISAEALRRFPGIIDKYIGDEVMLVFSREFGSSDPFVDAIQTARWMGENDFCSFNPHIGIASGLVVVGYVGTPIRYNCSVFGAPVALAARCAAVKPEVKCSTSIVFPAEEWGERDLSALISSDKWKLLEPREVSMKNLPDTMVRELVSQSTFVSQVSTEQVIREAIRELRKRNRSWPGGRQD
jgi:class 3 adenylate cyclase